MNKTGKILLLIVLAAPVLVYGFLKAFGKNKFDLPVMYQTGDEWPHSCSTPAFPYHIDDSVQVSVLAGKPAVVVWGDLPVEAARRFPTEIDTSGIRIVRLSGHQWPCLFGADSFYQAAMIDQQGRVRGLYKTLERDEADRVIMESKILLNDY